MAIYHASIKSFSRGKGESSVAAAAYRAGIDLIDSRLRVEHRYSQRKGVQFFRMLAPLGSPDWCLDAFSFWDANENGEVRANARLARELEVSLPSELEPDARERLALALGQALVDRFKAVVLVAVHAPSVEGDNRNHHVHLLMSARQVGPAGFGPRAGAEFEARNGKGADVVREVREWVGQIINEHLALAGQSLRVDHRSLKAQALEAAAQGDHERASELSRAPTRHIGKAQTWQARKSIEQGARLSIFEVKPADPFAAAQAQAAAEGRLVGTPTGHSHSQALAERPAGAGGQLPVLTKAEIRRKSWPRMSAEPSPIALRLAKVARLAKAHGRDAELLNAQAEMIEEWLETQREVAKHAIDALKIIPGIQFEPEFTAATDALTMQRAESYRQEPNFYEDTEALTRAVRDYAVVMRDPHDSRVALRRARDRLSTAENETGRFGDAALRSARRALVRAKQAVSPPAVAAQDKRIRQAREVMVEATSRLDLIYPMKRIELATMEDALASTEGFDREGAMSSRELKPRPTMRPH